jgi:hypothetical protein
LNVVDGPEVSPVTIIRWRQRLVVGHVRSSSRPHWSVLKHTPLIAYGVIGTLDLSLPFLLLAVMSLHYMYIYVYVARIRGVWSV